MPKMKDLPKPPKPPNPKADALSEADRKLYKELHEKFGKLGKSPLLTVIPPRLDRWTYDIELKEPSGSKDKSTKDKLK